MFCIISGATGLNGNIILLDYFRSFNEECYRLHKIILQPIEMEYLLKMLQELNKFISFKYNFYVMQMKLRVSAIKQIMFMRVSYQMSSHSYQENYQIYFRNFKDFSMCFRSGKISGCPSYITIQIDNTYSSPHL